MPKITISLSSMCYGGRGRIGEVNSTPVPRPMCSRADPDIEALKSSQYLKSLITHQQLAPKQSSILDELYAKHSPFQAEKSESSANSSNDGKPQILLNDNLIKELLEKFQLEEQAGTDLRRAVSQLEARLKNPDKPLKE